MSDKYIELLGAAKALLPYLEASTDHRDFLMSVRKESNEATAKAIKEYQKRDEQSPADKLRQRADEMEAQDAVINRFRAAVAEVLRNE